VNILLVQSGALQLHTVD